MSLGVRLLARLEKPCLNPDEFMDQIENWLLAKYSEMLPRARREKVDSALTLFCRLHPAGEDIELSLVNSSELVVSTKTTTVGPGYHVFVTSLLKDLATEFNAQWEQPDEDSLDYRDETGYFFTEDEQGLRDEMTRWLAGLANCFFDGTLDASGAGLALCLPVDPRFEVIAPAWTSLGPRDLDWLRRTAEDGNKGIDFFAWWNPGFDAEYYLRRALTLMWVDVRWRPPMNEFERRTLEEAARCLRRAHQLDPSLQYPWVEWKQLLSLAGVDNSEAELLNSMVEGKPSIGYRRNNVTVRLPGGWEMRVPGSFSDFEPDEDNNLCALDLPREIWFTAYRSNIDSAAEFDKSKKDAHMLPADYRIEEDGYFACAKISQKRRESGEEYFVLSSSNVALGGRSVCTILFSDPNQNDWAVETWRSIRPPQAEDDGSGFC